jgi:hypothetical protein
MCTTMINPCYNPKCTLISTYYLEMKADELAHAVAVDNPEPKGVTDALTSIPGDAVVIFAFSIFLEAREMPSQEGKTRYRCRAPVEEYLMPDRHAEMALGEAPLWSPSHTRRQFWF